MWPAPARSRRRAPHHHHPVVSPRHHQLAGFSIGAGGTVQFNNGSGAALNRVTGSQMSSIQGRLGATGSVFLINPNGVVIGPRGTVVAGGSFVASTRDTPDGTFMKGGAVTLSGTSSGGQERGRITSTGGNVVLVGNPSPTAAPSRRRAEPWPWRRATRWC
jgi:filamentous hemagglutinin family protein